MRDSRINFEQKGSAATQLGRIQPDNLQFARSGASFREARAFIQRVESAKKVVLLQQSAHAYGPRRDFAQVITSVLDAPTN